MACRQLTRLANASATRKTAFQVKNVSVPESTGSKGSSMKAWRTRAKFNSGMTLGDQGRSMSNAGNSDDRIGSLPGFQLPCNRKTELVADL